MPACLLCSKKITNTLTLEELLAATPFKSECVCQRCKQNFTPINPDYACPGCSRPMGRREFCPDCRKWQSQYPAALIQHSALFQYDAAMREWLQAYKFQGDIRLAQCFVKELTVYHRSRRRCLFVPLPLAQGSRQERGFNQCEELLKAAGLPYQHLLEHTGQGPKQSEKNRHERLALPQPFQMLPAASIVERSQEILLFDDVYTTGRTIMHAKESLQQEGFLQVFSLSLAR